MNYANWINSDVLSDKELDILNNMNDVEREDAFSKLIAFGTAGLRGIIGLGTNRMNIYTVSHVSQAIANYMKNRKMNRIVVACDVRHCSELFKNTTVDVFLENDIEVFIFNKLVPVSVLSYATKELGCDFGIYITASHNTREYNGYKLFDSTGCQIMDDLAEDINYYRDELDVLGQVKKSNKKSNIVPDFIFDNFIKEIKRCKIHNNNNLSITYTGLFGTGNGIVDKVLTELGFNVNVVYDESKHDGDFPGVKAPNPEIQSAFTRAIINAQNNESDIIIATDPDCDRVGVMVYHNSKYKLLTGNQVGILLSNYILKYGNIKNPDIVFSNVSTNMVSAICNKYCCTPKIVPTGFKHIGNKINSKKINFAFGFEESCGYLIGDYIRDKDAVGAAVLVSEMAAFYKKQQKTLIDVLEDLYKEFGYYSERTLSIVTTQNYSFVDILKKMENVRFKSITLNDSMLLLKYHDDTEVIFRKSGTEPKLKVYVKVFSLSKEETEYKLYEHCDRIYHLEVC